MLPSIVGPPLKGVADFKSAEFAKAENSRDEKKAGSDSFGEMLGEKVTQKAKDPGETRTERPERSRPESDEKAEKVTATKDNGVKKKEKGNSKRENAILNFMDSFESEFGVPPTKIVEAMANLKATDQVESPEATADQVIGQLELDDQQEDQAKAMYLGLLAQLSQMEQQAPPALLLPKLEGQSMLEVQGRFSSAQEKREVLNQSLDSMNQKFWMKGTTAAQGGVLETPLSDKLAQMSLQDKLLGAQSLQVDENLVTTQVPQPVTNLENPVLENTPENSEGEKSPQAALAALVAAARAAKGRSEIKDMASEFADRSATEIEAGSDLEAEPGTKSMKADAMKIEAAPENAAKNFEFGKNSQQQFGEGKQSFNSTGKNEMTAKPEEKVKADFKQSLGLEGLHGHAGSLKQEAAVGGAMVAAAPGAPAPTRAENEANIRQLMNQAQYLIKKGGGEMKVEMTPEGLGRINMKVLVQDGKVNVQMAADTQEARKTLESGLSDLKNSLAAHKLSMDHVKIDVVGAANTDSSAQNQMYQNNPGSRDQARQFWNNFGDNFGSGKQDRSSFSDIPSLKGYPRRRTDQELEPVRASSVNKYAESGKGNGLNLVA